MAFAPFSLGHHAMDRGAENPSRMSIDRRVAEKKRREKAALVRWAKNASVQMARPAPAAVAARVA